jgi:flagellar motor switch protein FliG
MDEMKQAGRVVTKVGGVEPAAEILSAMGRASEKRILSAIEETNPDLAEKIRELMFPFEDLTLIDSEQMQTILKDVDKADLAMALKTASDAVKEIILSSMSPRAAQILNEDLENMGLAKVVDVENAQQKIIEVFKKLEEEGKLIMRNNIV